MRPARNSLAWLYLLVLVPFVTDLIETARLPNALRDWVTEFVGGMVIGALVHKVRATHLAVEELARTDGLTGLWNRRAFDEALVAECARARRTVKPLSLVVIDLDHFKQVNDGAGHLVGDRVLEQFAAAIRSEIRVGVDRGFRIGGDEFALLLPETSSTQAEVVLARIHRHCGVSDPIWVDGPLGLSAGFAEFDRSGQEREFLRRADEAMYVAKGRRGS